jgi:glutamate dehydrogenase
VRERIGAALAELYDGRVSAFVPSFPDTGLARVHFIIGRNPGTGPDPAQTEVEARIRAICRTWEDDLFGALAEAFSADRAAALLESWRGAFASDYRALFTAREAVEDIRVAQALSPGAVAARFFRRADVGPDEVALRLHHLESPIPLSVRVPLLENMGFFVINERSFQVEPAGAPPLHKKNELKN